MTDAPTFGRGNTALRSDNNKPPGVVEEQLPGGL